ncbi:DUF4199 domain-containing protein [Pontibacter burrus]|uniref:DUF4199 domain-containing protein n=1 Tax=Pontibacter burrus TaxID=2704466 RepID=A0A6B3LU22_9BACT|nr:DUF4199 domain-containing protein [Pontibacter burrus]NEM96994.1 DUF4199 domain-containing protein [Pontibacter burrus]
MTETQPSVTSSAIKYGLISALIGIVYMLILYVTDKGDNIALSSVIYIIIILGIYLGMKEYKSINNGYMSYGQGLGIGSIVSVVFGLLLGAATWVYTTFIDSGYTQRVLERQREKFLDSGMTDEQIDRIMASAEAAQGPLMAILGSALLYLIVGFLLSLIISAIVKNNRPEFE